MPQLGEPFENLPEPFRTVVLFCIAGLAITYLLSPLIIVSQLSYLIQLLKRQQGQNHSESNKATPSSADPFE